MICDHLALMLEETRLSENQIISPVDGSGFREITADITNTWQLRWWILGESDRIEVLEPEELRLQIAESLSKSYQQYLNNEENVTDFRYSNITKHSFNDLSGSTAMIDWNITFAAIWIQRQEYLRPVKQIDPVRLNQLLGVETQKQQLIENTERFLTSQPANNTLLWGARGTGKSSLVKALLNEYKHRGLRLIEVDKQDLIFLPEIVDDIREQSQRFVIYCDDLSFDSGDTLYKSLKSVLEGSIELPPENVSFYATSNRRHLLPEQMRDNLDTRLIDGEVHYSDTIEEKISLSDRFGLRLAFYPQATQTYLDIVDHHFVDYLGNREDLHLMAPIFASSLDGNGLNRSVSAVRFYDRHRT